MKFKNLLNSFDKIAICGGIVDQRLVACLVVFECELFTLGGGCFFGFFSKNLVLCLHIANIS